MIDIVAVSERDRRRAFGILFAVSIVTSLGVTGMQSILPSIGREIGIPDPMVAAIFSLSALLWAATSPIWARQADLRGRKPMIILGLAGFMMSMLCCGLVVSAGLRHLAAPAAIFVLFLFARALFGTFGSAASPATQAYMAERTGRDQRTETMAALAGATGLGTIIGPAVAPLFILPIVGLAGPMYTFALIALVTLVVVARGLPEAWAGPRRLTPGQERFVPAAAKAEGKLRPLWRDPRLTPFLVYGFLIASCQTANTQILGFMIIDKLHLPPLKAQGFITVAMMTGAIAGVLAQWGLIRMFRMNPKHLLRWGAGLAAAACLMIALAPDYWSVVVGYALAVLGFSFARPGFTAGASLAVSGEEQARVAGAIAAVNGVNVVLGPAYVKLYEMVHAAPFLLNAAILAAMLAYAFLSQPLRSAGENPATDADAALATLERTEEGS
ncbi:MFS transporter [Caulobacter sp. CCUG 60055]|uniref:MFS transporter n=1 Tax=Caulobacter sp. CCUG 60055 TaxID=2100090 RepID=UPI001FA7F898|nr:MFS transporter [Caulobacter sp. CCUG 60055]MBQ1543019.1 MFS transporter [Caulobacteraceae bacterium]MCI3180078.1 MFS transporter [Caulobacter sp. CCUG 60055]